MTIGGGGFQGRAARAHVLKLNRDSQQSYQLLGSSVWGKPCFSAKSEAEAETVLGVAACCSRIPVGPKTGQMCHEYASRQPARNLKFCNFWGSGRSRSTPRAINPKQVWEKHNGQAPFGFCKCRFSLNYSLGAHQPVLRFCPSVHPCDGLCANSLAHLLASERGHRKLPAPAWPRPFIAWRVFC